MERVSLAATLAVSIMEEELKKLGPNQRKRRIEELLETGEIQKKRCTDTFEYFEKGEKDFLYGKCVTCGFFVTTAPGGHRTYAIYTYHSNWKTIFRKHLHKTCIGMKRGTNEISSEEMMTACANYCIRSGQSFSHFESTEFRELMRTVTRDENLKLPNRKSIKQACVRISDDVLDQLGALIHGHVKNQTASLILDFGKHVHDYLCIFIGFINTEPSQDGTALLNLLPFAFTPTTTKKTAENVRDMIIARAAKFGLSAQEITSLSVVSDGGRNLVAMGKRYFRDWSLCACHGLQKLSERTISPTKVMTQSLEDDDLAELESCSRMLDMTAKVSSLLHNSKKVTVSNLPPLFIPTRWQTQVRCAREVMLLLSQIRACECEEAAKLARKIQLDQSRLEDCVSVLNKFEPLLLMFEKSTISIQHVLPRIVSLNRQFKTEMESSLPGTTRHILSKSATLATDIYLEKNISDIHKITTFMTPGYRKLGCLPEDMREPVMEVVELALRSMPEPFETNQEVIDDGDNVLYDPVEKFSSNEIERYLADTLSSREEPMDFWIKRREEYPQLYQLAMRSFAVLSSESVCERAFSRVKRVVTDLRQNMDAETVEKIMISNFFLNSFK